MPDGWTQDAVCRTDYNAFLSGSSLYCGPLAGSWEPGTSATWGTGAGANTLTFRTYAFYLNYDPTNFVHPDRYAFRLTKRWGLTAAQKKAALGNEIEWWKQNFPNHPLPRNASTAPMPEPMHWPDYMPNFYPDALPVNNPGWEVKPWPISIPSPRPAPYSPQAPDVGPRPDPKPRPNPDPFPEPNPYPGTAPKPNPNPRTHPGTNPRSSTDFDLAPGVRVSPRPGHKPRPPGPNTKEGKAGMGPIASALWRGMGPLTEANDVLKELYEALPRSIKIKLYRKNGRQPTAQEKALAIYQNMGDLDLPKALTGILQNHYEDKIIGYFGSQLGKASKASGRPIGYAAGPAL